MSSKVSSTISRSCMRTHTGRTSQTSDGQVAEPNEQWTWKKRAQQGRRAERAGNVAPAPTAPAWQSSGLLCTSAFRESRPPRLSGLPMLLSTFFVMQGLHPAHTRLASLTRQEWTGPRQVS